MSTRVDPSTALVNSVGRTLWTGCKWFYLFLADHTWEPLPWLSKYNAWHGEGRVDRLGRNQWSKTRLWLLLTQNYQTVRPMSCGTKCFDENVQVFNNSPTTHDVRPFFFFGSALMLTSWCYDFRKLPQSSTLVWFSCDDVTKGQD